MKAAFVWKHGQSIDLEFRRVMRNDRLLAAGISDKVAWQGKPIYRVRRMGIEF